MAEQKLTHEQINEALDERHTPKIQELLSRGNVAIAGLGGLGSNIAYSLARIGVGHLHLIDFDVVDITNLNPGRCFLSGPGRVHNSSNNILLSISACIRRMH